MGNEVSVPPEKHGRRAYHVKPISVRTQHTSQFYMNNHNDDIDDIDQDETMDEIALDTKLLRSHQTPISKPIHTDTPIAYQIASMSSMIVSIEGNIGSGKSTVLRKLKTSQEFTDIQTHLMRPVIFIDEPVKDWETIRDNDHTILEKFYSDPKKYAFSFQIMAYATRFQAIQQALKKHPNCILITERCLETDKHVFARMLFESGDISTIDYQIYKKCYDAFSSIVTDKHIYIKTTPEVCFTRIHKRSRQGEETIQLDYLKDCGKVHDEWLSPKTNVHMIHGDNDFETDSNQFAGIMKEIMYVLNPNVQTSYLDTLFADKYSVHKPIRPISSSEILTKTIHSC